MNLALTWIFVVLVFAFLATGLTRADRMYQFPFLAGVMTFGFLLPQIPALVNDPFLPDGAYEKTMFMGVMALLMLALGWWLGKRPIGFLSFSFSERRLLWSAAGLSAIGGFFYFLLSRLPGEISIGTQMTGLPVIYLFFAQLMPYGLGIALLCFARKPSWLALAIILFDLLFYVDRIIITGKRAEAIQLVLMVLLAFWFYRRWVIPRTLMFVGMFAGTFLMTSMGDYRQITGSHDGFDLGRVLDIDFKKNFMDTLEKGGLEMRNAVIRIDDIDQQNQFDYGKFHWNRVIFTFVPAQVVGASVKEALTLDVPGPSRSYNPELGTTETGLVDAFASFWYFGVFKFLLLAWVMKRLWVTANSGEMLGQLIYMLSIVPAMHAISHQTDWVIPVWIHMAIFLTPILIFCHVATPVLPLGQYRRTISQPLIPGGA